MVGINGASNHCLVVGVVPRQRHWILSVIDWLKPRQLLSPFQDTTSETTRGREVAHNGRVRGLGNLKESHPPDPES